MFRFSLQTALDVRLRQEKIKMKELAEKIAVEQSIKDEITKVQDQTGNAEHNVNSKKKEGRFTIAQLSNLTNFKEKKKLELADYSQQLELAKRKVKEKQDMLIQASKLRKTLEILRDKEKQRFLEKNAQFERKNMDEIAGNQFILKKVSF